MRCGLPDPDDGRARLVTITDKGQHAVRLAADEVAAVEEEWTAHLGADRILQLRQALTQLREITDPWAERSKRPADSRIPGHHRSPGRTEQIKRPPPQSAS